ncbi:MAG: response regulator [Anaerolineae bacterium]
MKVAGGTTGSREIMKAYQILLVDDDLDFVKATKLVLESVGYKVTIAGNGKEALAQMRAEKPDLLILDIIMKTPLEGVAVSQAMWEDDELREIPIIMVSCIASSEHAWLFPTDGYLHCIDFLFKPFKPSDLLDSVRRLLK